jgi:hypothetical protein
MHLAIFPQQRTRDGGSRIDTRPEGVLLWVSFLNHSDPTLVSNTHGYLAWQSKKNIHEFTICRLRLPEAKTPNTQFGPLPPEVERGQRGVQPQKMCQENGTHHLNTVPATTKQGLNQLNQHCAG